MKELLLNGLVIAILFLGGYFAGYLIKRRQRFELPEPIDHLADFDRNYEELSQKILQVTDYKEWINLELSIDRLNNYYRSKINDHYRAEKYNSLYKSWYSREPELRGRFSDTCIATAN